MSSLYERLDKNDIRLLTVSVHDKATTSLVLHTYPRTAAPEYDAVSYTWGDNTSATSVMCNGVSLEIRTNLFRALSFINNFRPEPRTRPLWVDAICLNQEDDREKEVHVPRMGEVYENASRTLIWLGEAADNSDLAFDNIESLTQKLLSVKNQESLTIVQTLTHYDLPPHNDQKWKAIKVLQLRPWFYRLWTFQEIVLSKEPVLLCGSKWVSWDALVALHEAAIKESLGFIVKADADPKTPFKQPQAVLHFVEFLRNFRKGSTAASLPMLLLLSGDREYSVAVDRVWALLGLLNKRYQQYMQNLVDYGETAKSQYHKSFLGIVKLHIEHDKAMAMQLIEDNLRTTCNPLLPSWCPDWHTEKGGQPIARWSEALAGYPGGQSCRIEPFMQVNEDSSLELCGLTVDVIECMTESAGEGMLGLESYPWLLQCLKIIDSTTSGPHITHSTSATIPATLVTSVEASPRSESRQRYMRAEEVLKSVLFPLDMHLKARTILKCNGRKFFRTKAGRVGIGPPNLEENDFLCAMYGARTIWALRPHKSSDKTRGQVVNVFNRQITETEEFELLGSVYTPSLLKGEAWVGTSCESMQRFRLT